ncbi:hypothetical protein MMC30_008841 [Trapelia coarctata]|nr:hypothetical protein [Trapelia coarctata]
MEAPNPQELQVVTTLRHEHTLRSLKENDESSFYMLPFHRERMIDAARDLNWPARNRVLIVGTFGAQYLRELLVSHITKTYPNNDPVHLFCGSLRLRITMNHAGDINITSSPCAPLALGAAFPQSLFTAIPTLTRAWRVQLSPTPVAETAHTRHKTTLRTPYVAARAHLSQEQLDVEVLIFNEHDQLMEGTLTTPYFLRDGRWMTPDKACGGNRGTTRRWALNKGLCYEGIIKRESIKVGEFVWLSNGVRGFGWGVVENKNGRDIAVAEEKKEEVPKMSKENREMID